ncbi:MurR/RpiR family transcriptional regulator [Pleomorphomonas sp. PLEO]|uniref:MurR/RpiR family transcriptional regulator n=1 Tax=Pleomorphomonas sp. PLEO TaxID=3239306 RepID=UPI00351E047C
MKAPASKLGLVDQAARLVERGSPAMARAASFVSQNAEQVVRSSIADISRACGAGESTIIRLCQTLGFDGFGAFKLALAGEIERERVLHVARGPSPEPRARMKAAGDARLADIAAELISTVQSSASRIDPGEMAKLAELLRRAKRVVAYGISISGICAEVFATRLAYRGIIVHVPRSGDLAHAAAATLVEGDVAIGISYNGLSEETVAFLKRAHDQRCHTFAVTTQKESPLAKAAQTVIELSIFGAWPKEGSSRLLPSMLLLTEFVATLIEQ